LKYDNCGSENPLDPNYNGPPEVGYTLMSSALNSTGRHIFFAACEWAVNFPATWMRSVANTWRTTYDIQNYWECVVSHVDWTNVFAPFAGPGGCVELQQSAVAAYRQRAIAWRETATRFCSCRCCCC